MRRLPVFIAATTGWRHAAVAAAAGALTVLALAPLHLWYLPFATLTVLVWLIDGACLRAAGALARAKAAALTGWCFGFGYFLAGLYWIGNSFLVEGAFFVWLMPFAVLGMASGLAVFHAAGTALAAALWRPGPARLFALTLGLFLAELARGRLFTGLPWNTLGYALAANDAMMQWASLFGVYGLTGLAVAIFTAPAASLDLRAVGSGRRPIAGLAYAVVALTVLCGGWGWGKMRLAAAPEGQATGVRLRIVQPNIPQREKWKPENRERVFWSYIALSRDGPAAAPAGLDTVTHLVWPESAMPFLLADSPQGLEIIAELLPDRGTLLTGQARLQEERQPDGSTRQNIYNSVLVIDGAGRIAARYDKRHLVPFGEYLPFQETLESIGLEQLTRVRGGFAPGTGQRLLDPPGAPAFVPLICYEVIFPYEIRAPNTAPAWMLNVTNDAWFGATAGPYQHFHQARVRAVEQGLPLVRAANTGISAVIDPYGRIVASLPLGTQGVIDAALPAVGPRTWFLQAGKIPLVVYIILLLVGWFLCTSRRTRAGRRR